MWISPGGLLTGEGRSTARDRHRSPPPPILQDHHKESQTPGYQVQGILHTLFSISWFRAVLIQF